MNKTIELTKNINNDYSNPGGALPYIGTRHASVKTPAVHRITLCHLTPLF